MLIDYCFLSDEGLVTKSQYTRTSSLGNVHLVNDSRPSKVRIKGVSQDRLIRDLEQQIPRLKSLYIPELYIGGKLTGHVDLEFENGAKVEMIFFKAGVSRMKDADRNYQKHDHPGFNDLIRLKHGDLSVEQEIQVDIWHPVTTELLRDQLIKTLDEFRKNVPDLIKQPKKL